ncbi:MAG: aminoacyl-tRNA hydrolase, partial [Candidatus Aminicenantales bacterium]
TYMNNSGLAVKSMVEGSWVIPDHLVVIYDDLAIPLGEIRIRKEGGAGSHRGLISIIKEIQTTKFPRIRIGIGPLPPGEEAVPFVLSAFRPEEKVQLEHSLERAQQALDLILENKIERAMSLYNRRRSKELEIQDM